MYFRFCIVLKVKTVYFYIDYLGLQFAEFLLETIENHNSENFIDMLITLILAFNLQFTDPQQNPIIEAMQSVPTVKSFTEKILLLLNREGAFLYLPLSMCYSFIVYFLQRIQ